MIDFTGKTDVQIVKLLHSHFNYLQNERKPFEPLWQLLTKLFLPRRYDILRNQQSGQKYGATIYDDHPANAANKHTLGVLGHTISKSMTWLQFIASKQTLMADDSVKKYVQEATEQVLWSFSQSNFYGANFWGKKDETVIGTGCLWPQEDLVNGRIVYTPIHPGEIYFADDQYGNAAVFVRPFKLTAIVLLEKFGKDKLPEDIVKNATGADTASNPFKMYDCLLSVYKNVKPNPDSLAVQDKAYRIFYTLLSGKEDSKKLLMSSGIDYFPIDRRYGKESGNAYGTSLAADALTASQVVNKLSEKSLQLVHKMVEPPMRAHENLRGKLYLNAGGRTYVANENEVVEQIYQSNTWPISDAQMEKMHDAIDDRFFIRFFELLSGRDLPQITAYQAARMEGEKVTLMNSIIDNEEVFLEKAVDIQWKFEEQAGRMPQPPQILFEPGNNRINVKYTGPLFQAQKQLLKTRGTVDWLQLVSGINAIWPNAKIKVNELELIEDAGIAMGMEQKMFKSDEEIAAILQEQAEREEQMEQAQMALQAAKAVPSLQKKTESGSPLDVLAEAAT